MTVLHVGVLARVRSVRNVLGLGSFRQTVVGSFRKSACFILSPLSSRERGETALGSFRTEWYSLELRQDLVAEGVDEAILVHADFVEVEAFEAEGLVALQPGEVLAK